MLNRRFYCWARVLKGASVGIGSQRPAFSFWNSMAQGNETGPKRCCTLILFSPDLQSHRDTGGAISQYPKAMLSSIHKKMQALKAAVKKGGRKIKGRE